MFDPIKDAGRLEEPEMLQALLDNCFGDISNTQAPVKSEDLMPPPPAAGSEKASRPRKELYIVGAALFGLLLKACDRQQRWLQRRVQKARGARYPGDLDDVEDRDEEGFPQAGCVCARVPVCVCVCVCFADPWFLVAHLPLPITTRTAHQFPAPPGQPPCSKRLEPAA